MIMKYEDIQRINAEKVLDSIGRRIDTVALISKRLKLNPVTVEKLCALLESKGLISKKIEKINTLGRPAFKYYLNTCYYSVYIQETEDYIKCICINAHEGCPERFNKRKHPDIPMEILFSRIDRDLNYFDEGLNNCLGIYIDCSEKAASFMPSNYQRLKTEELIVNSFLDKSIISLFEFEDLIVLNVYGNVVSTQATLEEILKVLPVSEAYTFEKPYYDDVFTALADITLEKMKRLI